MLQSHDFSRYISRIALKEGALLVGYTKIRRVEPVIIFGFPFTDQWFLKEPFLTTKMLLKDYSVSKHVQNTVARVLKKKGYTAHYKTILSLYGDFRPLAVSAGLGEWGRNGIVVNRDFGSNLLFAALFTNAPVENYNPGPTSETQTHCIDCGQCLGACPAKAFEGNRFHIQRCLPYSVKGCAECLKICTKKH